MANKKKSRRRQATSPAPPVIPMSQELAGSIEQWSEEACEAHGVELVDVEMLTAGRWILRVYAQRPGNPAPGKGITIEECAQVSRFLEAMLDAEERMPENYMLEVSSPGIERPLKKLVHFEQVKGSQARVVLRQAVQGVYAFQGEVLGADMDSEQVLLEVDGEQMEFKMSMIKKAHVVYDFDQSGQ